MWSLTATKVIMLLIEAQYFFFFCEFAICLPLPLDEDGIQGYEEDGDGLVFFEDYNVLLSRHRRSANDTSGNSTTASPDPAPAAPDSNPKYSNAVEEFYADPNNRAMYLVLPLIILVYGGCSSIYCIYKCRRYLKRRRLENQMKDMKREDSPTCSTNIEDQQDSELITIHKTMNNNDYQRDVPRPVPIMTKKPVSPDPPMVRASSRNTVDEDGMSLDDLEDELETENKKQEEETSFTDTKPKPVSIYPQLASQEDRSNSTSSEKRQDGQKTNEGAQGKKSVSPAQESRPVSKQTEDKHSCKKDLPKVKKFSDLTPQDVEDILNYYNDKKHMPDVIPDDTENMLPIRRKANKWKYRVFNT